MTTTLETTLVNIFETSFVPTKPIEDVVACLFAKMADNFGSFNINEDIDKMSALEVCRISHKVNAVICRYIKANYSKEILKKYNDMASNYIEQQINLRLQNNQLSEIRDLLLPKLISGELVLDALPEVPELAEAF